MVVNFDIFHYFWDFVCPSVGPTTGSTIGPSVGPSISLIAQVKKVAKKNVSDAILFVEVGEGVWLGVGHPKFVTKVDLFSPAS